ncbi:hypothetical protein MSIBF_A1350016 [groundwater metagenome]|uniref:Uncharacterized protein n=1 Tax=groundwater metagenome TaxID=717931 RepID=A0A098E8F8_9ZZZZ
MVTSESNKEKIKKQDEEEYWTRYVILDNGKMEKVMVSKKETMKDINELLEEDKDFLDIMKKL